MQEIEDFTYPGLAGDAHCRIRIAETEERTVVVASPAPNTPACGIANTVERLAAEVCKRGLATPERLLLVEHDPGRTAVPRENPGLGLAKPPRFEIVALHVAGDGFAPRAWLPYSQAELEELIGEPFQLE